MPCSTVDFVLMNTLRLNHEHVCNQQPTVGKTWKLKVEMAIKHSGTKR